MHRPARTCVTVIVCFDDGSKIEGAAIVGLRQETDEGGHAQEAAGPLLVWQVAQKGQSVAPDVIEPVFAAGRVLDPFRVIAAGEDLGWLAHPGQAHGACTHAQAAVERTQPTERKNAGFPVVPAQG